MAEGADKQENMYEVNKFISDVFKHVFRTWTIPSPLSNSLGPNPKK